MSDQRIYILSYPGAPSDWQVKPHDKILDEHVRDLSVQVYKVRLGERDTALMLARDADDGTKLRTRAAIYDHLVRIVIDALRMPTTASQADEQRTRESKT